MHSTGRIGQVQSDGSPRFPVCWERHVRIYHNVTLFGADVRVALAMLLERMKGQFLSAAEKREEDKKLEWPTEAKSKLERR